jgi:hypothetical protein
VYAKYCSGRVDGIWGIWLIPEKERSYHTCARERSASRDCTARDALHIGRNCTFSYAYLRRGFPADTFVDYRDSYGRSERCRIIADLGYTFIARSQRVTPGHYASTSGALFHYGGRFGTTAAAREP